MAEINVSIDNLFRQVFGAGRGKPFQVTDNNLPGIREGGEFPDVVEDGTEEGATFLNLRNTLGSNLPNGRTVFMPVEIGGLLLPNEPTIAIDQEKVIQETALVGSRRRGTVKEQIGFADPRITLRGIIINYDNKRFFPEDQTKKLQDLFQEGASLEIKCALTSLLGIYRVVIKRFFLPEMIGVQHAQAYQLDCVADEDFNLELE